MRNWLRSLTGYVWSPPDPGLFDFKPTDEKHAPGPGFLGLWAVQAALVAVVYPIVVAFVTVLIQRQAASKASLQAYFASSGENLTGLSSLMLVALLALQFVLLDSFSALAGFAWIVGDYLQVHGGGS
jgi:hypothetical protein